MDKLTRLCLGLAAALLAAPAQAKVHAVLIGIDQYEDADVTPLKYTVEDVRAFRDVLIDPNFGGAEPDNVVLMIPGSAAELRPVRGNILYQVARAARRTEPDDLLILYFAGHGMQTEEGQYLLGVDARPLVLAETAVSMETLRRMLGTVQARQVLLIIDACRNDPNAGRAQADNTMTDAFARSLRPRVLNPVESDPRKIATWFACDVGERAWELTSDRHGVFSYHLLAGLRGGCRDDQGQVTLTRLADYVGEQVTGWARQEGKTQTPRLDNPNGLEFTLARIRLPAGPGATVREIPVLARLSVTTQPAGARVLVDGEEVGATPLAHDLVVANGQERRAIVSIELDGFIPRHAEVTLVPGDTARWEQVELRPATAPPAVRTGLTEPTGTDPGGRPGRPTVQPEISLPVRPPVTPPAGIEGLPGWYTAFSGEIGPASLPPMSEPVMLTGVGTGRHLVSDYHLGPDGLPMVKVPSGSFLMGTDRGKGESNEGPQHAVSLSEYYITATEVTNEAYARMLNAGLALGLVKTDDDGNVVDAGGWPLLWTVLPTCGLELNPKMQRFTARAGQEQLPVAGVTWYGAAFYAAAYGMTLPSEAQWERAAIGDSQHDYPWGRRFDPVLANTGDRLGGPVPAGTGEGGESEFGARHMVGNLWEWTMDHYTSDYHRFPRPHDPIHFDTTSQVHTVRGGSYRSPDDLVSARTRTGLEQYAQQADVGFRCVYQIASLHTPGGWPGQTAEDEDDDDSEEVFSPPGSTAHHHLVGLSFTVPPDMVATYDASESALAFNSFTEDTVGIYVKAFAGGVFDLDVVMQAMITEATDNGFVFQQQPRVDDVFQLSQFSPPLRIRRLVYRGHLENEEFGIALHSCYWNGHGVAIAFVAEVDRWAQVQGLYEAFLASMRGGVG